MQSTDDMMESSTPSPTAQTPTPSSSSAARRPPRKSTLTQQQRNQKRQRATQDQLVTLEIEFNKNPTPTAVTRERIASEINMTERSVQIWFQNRCEGLLFTLQFNRLTFKQASQDKEHRQEEHRKR